MEGPLCTSYVAGAAVADLDVTVLSLQPLYEDSTSLLNANSRETRSERTVIIECIKTPSDTFVHTEKQKALAERKNLVLCEDDCFVGYAKLRPVTSSLWGQFVTKGEESEPLLKHIPLNQNRQQHQSRTAYSWEVVLGFRCAWPAIAAEWLQRHRPVDWPSAAMVDELVKDTCRVVPVCHPHNRSSSDTEWKFSFSISQVKLAHSALIPSQRACFHAFKVLLDYTFKGLQPLDMDLLVSVFFYICEEIPHDQWTAHPSWCVLRMVEQLQQGLASHFLPDYFIRAANRFSHLTDDQHVEKYVTVLDSLQKQIVVHVYFMLDDHNFLRSELNMVFDRCLEDCQQLAQHGDLSRCVQECFIECSAELVHGYILGKYYERARTMCVNLFQDLTTLGSSAGNMSLRDLLNAVVRRLPLYLKCCFALYLDHGLKTNILEEICCDRESVPISNLLGVDFGRNVLTTSTDIRIPSELTSPDKVFEFLLEMDFLLVDEMYLGEEWNSCLHHFLREHTPRLLQHVTRGPVRKHAVGFEAMTKLKLRILFISLYTRYMHKSELYRLADMMEQIELLCEFYPCFSLLNCLSDLWSSFNDAEKAREARMKADSVTIEFM